MPNLKWITVIQEPLDVDSKNVDLRIYVLHAVVQKEETMEYEWSYTYVLYNFDYTDVEQFHIK